MLPWLLLRALIFVAVLAAVILIPAAGGSTPRDVDAFIAPGCTKYASPSGSDTSGTGQIGRPYLTVAKLDRSLAPSQAGCLLAGTYGSTSTVYDLTNSGSASGGDITITAYPGEAAKLVGLVELEGSYTVLSDLDIDGSNTSYSEERPGTSCPYPVSNGLEIDGNDDVFQFNDYSQSVAGLRGNGIGIGWNGQADDVVVRYNRIHDVGQCDAYDHLIYLAHSTGARIYDNWIWNDPHGWGVQLYPDAVDAHVYDNVIDHAGSGFVVGGASTGDLIDHNVVTNSTGLPDAGLPRGVGISESDPGANNTFQSNDVFNNPGGIGNDPSLKLTANTTTNPGLADASAHDYSVAPGSPLAGWGLWNGSVG
jgi:hypothetical protein